MIDREKVIKGLECCFKYETHTASGLVCEECPYNNDSSLGTCTAMLFIDTIELLKEQTPKPPRIFQTVDKIFYACDNCGKSLFVIMDSGTLYASSVFPKFCSECGRAVKWGDN